ncbi:MAG: hypothetical protein CSA19_01060 [Deltaproteobacteria bacterium]|nr:MAG: hypothetical protein CSA19_01060 [Deltaproteobacteria bacterium]
MQTLGTKIILDEEKILREGKYDLERIYEVIDDLAEQLTLVKTDKHTYMTRGNEQDLANLGLFCRLRKFDWVATNVAQWIWLDNQEGNTDMVKKYNLGA